jgi:hypothetical protein
MYVPQEITNAQNIFKVESGSLHSKMYIKNIRHTYIVTNMV